MGLLSFIVALWAPSASAQSSLKLSSTDNSWSKLSAAIRAPLAPKPQFEYSGSVFMDTSMSLSDSQHASWEGFYKASIGLQDVKNNYSIGTEIAYTQEYTYVRDDGNDGDFFYWVLYGSKSWKNGKSFQLSWLDSVSLGVTGSLPVGRESGRRTFEGGVGPSLTLAKKIGRFSLSEGVSYSHSFYQYDLRSDGTANNPEVMKSKSSVGFELTEKLSAQALYIYTEVASVYGTMKGADTTYLELDYAVLKKLTLSAGIATDRASTLDPDGQVERIKFYEPQSSAAYLDVTLDF